MTAEYRRTYEISALAEWESKLPDLFKEEGRSVTGRFPEVIQHRAPGTISPCIGQWLTNKTMEYHRPLRSTAESDVYETNRRGNPPESESFAALVSQVRRPGTAGERG